MKELNRFLNKGQHQISSRMKTFLFSLLAITENFKNTCTAFNLFFFVTQASNTIVESEYSGAILDVFVHLVDHFDNHRWFERQIWEEKHKYALALSFSPIWDLKLKASL